MFDNTPSDRVQFRALGELQPPGACLICGTGTREEGYVDLGVYIDYHGQTYLCVLCVTQVGEVIGMLTNDEAQIIRGQQSDLLTQVAALKATVEEDNERLAAYATILSNPGNRLGPGGIDLSDIPLSSDVEDAPGDDSRESETEESDSNDGRLISVGASEQNDGSKPEPELFEL